MSSHWIAYKAELSELVNEVHTQLLDKQTTLAMLHAVPYLLKRHPFVKIADKIKRLVLFIIIYDVGGLQH